nr:MAG: RNA-dependent RNA polymerase [Wufeng shrew phenuivirus 10]
MELNALEILSESYPGSSFNVLPDMGNLELYDGLFKSIREVGPNLSEEPVALMASSNLLVCDWDLHVDRSKDCYMARIDYQDPDSVSVSKTIKPCEFALTPLQARCFPHDFTFSFLSTHTDYRLNQFFDLPETPHTPDCIFTLCGMKVVLEFTTTSNDTPDSLKRALTVKWAKYLPDLLTIRGPDADNTAYHVIAVGATTIASTLHLDQNLIDELTLRFRLAKQIQIQWALEDDDSTPEFFALRNYLKTIDHVPLFQQPTQDREALRKSFSSSIQEEKARLLSRSPTDPFQTIGKRCDINACLRVPISLPNPSQHEHDFIFSMPFIESNSALTEVWYESIFYAQQNSWRFNTMQDFHSALDEKLLEDHIMVSKREKFRVNPELSYETQYKLALDGINAKQMRRRFRNVDADLIAKRSFKQEGFSMEVPVSDISAVIESDWWTDEDESPVINLDIILQSLAASTEDSFKGPASDINFRIVKYAYFVSIMAQQILFCKQKFCPPSQFVLQPIPGYEAYLLVKPTSCEGHIFFSLLWASEKVLETTITPAAEEVWDHSKTHKQWYINPFQSVKFGTLENWVKLPFRVLTTLETLKEITGKCSKECLKRNIFPVLMSLANKPETEEVVTVSRYAYMEMFRLKKDPYKVRGKLPDVCHSRLTIWAIKRLQTICDYIVGNSVGLVNQNIREIIEDDSIDVCQTTVMYPVPAINGYYTICSVDEMLAEVYTGYWVNKNQDQEKNQNLKLYKKIFVMEAKHLYDDHCNQYDGVYSGRYHEWDSTMLTLVAKHMQEYFTTLMGPSYKQQIMVEFYNMLSSASLLELATLKSSNTSSIEDPYTPRSKVLPELYKQIEDIGDDMASAIKWAFKKINETGFLINIFKKAQHGGLREISIMNLAGRIIQYSIESLSRILCSKIPEESMTHPYTKNSPIIRHVKRVSSNKEAERKWHTFYTSADAEKWNQTLSPAKFDFLLCSVLPEEMHGFVHAALSLWTNKLILVDEHTKKVLLDPCFRSRDPMYNLMSAKMRNNEPPFLAENNSFFKVETGMLQGLLHFTSSFFHGSALHAWKAAIQSKRPEVKISFLVSSDDAGVMYSIKSGCGRKGQTKAYRKAILFESIRLAFLDHMGIKTSLEKSTFLSPDVFEFNSIWSVGLSQARASIKFALSSITLADSGTLASRQEQLCTSRQQLLESGITISTVRDVSFIQGLFYYTMIGGHVHPFFKDFLELITLNKDFFAGWFLCDTPMMSGVATTSYNLWSLCKRTDYGSILAGALKEVDREKMVARSGAVLLSSHASFVRSKLYKLILSKMENRSHVMELLNNNPSVLFRKPRTQDELKAGLLNNFTNPKTVYSLARDRQYEARVFVASCYMISSGCMSMGTAWLEDLEEKEGEIPKCSLLTMALKPKKTAVFSEEVERIFFPNVREFERLAELERSLIATTATPLHVNLIKNHTRVTVIRPGTDYACTLLNACAWRWGYEQRKISQYALDSVWQRYQVMYPWLKNSLEDTLVSGAFTNVLQLRETLAHESQRGHILNVNTCNAYGATSSLVSFIRNNYKKGHRLGKVSDASYYPDLQHVVTQLSWLQPRQEIQEQLLKRILKHDFNELNIPESLKPFWIWSNSESAEQFLEMVPPNCITLGGYVRRGMYQGGVYRGETVWQGGICGVNTQVQCKDHSLTFVAMQGSATTFNKIRQEFRVLCSDHKWTFSRNFFSNEIAINSAHQLQCLTGWHEAVKIIFLPSLNITVDPVKLLQIVPQVSDRNNLRLIGVYEDVGVRHCITLVSRFMPEAIKVSFTQNSVKGLLGKLINNEPLTYVEFKTVVTDVQRSEQAKKTLDTIKLLMRMKWKSEGILSSVAGVTDVDDEPDPVEAFDLEAFEDEFFMEFAEMDDDKENDAPDWMAGFMDIEQQPVEQQEEKEEDIIKGLLISDDLLAAFGSTVPHQRSEFLKLINILPIDKAGRAFAKAIRRGVTRSPGHIELAAKLGFSLSLEEIAETPTTESGIW